jgi:hypothetical protein
VRRLKQQATIPNINTYQKHNRTQPNQKGKERAANLPEFRPEGRQNRENTWRNCDTLQNKIRDGEAHFPIEKGKNKENGDRGSVINRKNYLKNSQIYSNSQGNRIEKGKAKDNSMETQPEFNFQLANGNSAAKRSSVAAQPTDATQTNPWITNDITEIIELHTTAWKLGMQISEKYGSSRPDHPFKYNLTQKYCDPNSLYY